MSYLDLAKRAHAELGSDSGACALEEGLVLEARQDLVAVLLYSELLERELWLCRDERAAAEIAIEFPTVPVLTFAEVPHLRGKPPELLHALLDAKVEFPDARLRADGEGSHRGPRMPPRPSLDDTREPDAPESKETS